MHNSVVFYRKPHNFSFYPIIHKKVLIFQRGRFPFGERPLWKCKRENIDFPSPFVL